MQRISAVGAALYYSRAWYRPQYKHGQGGRGIKSSMIPRLKLLRFAQDKLRKRKTRCILAGLKPEEAVGKESLNYFNEA